MCKLNPFERRKNWARALALCTLMAGLAACQSTGQPTTIVQTVEVIREVVVTATPAALVKPTEAPRAEVDPDALPMAEKVGRWTMENMRDSSGYFHYRKYPALTAKTPYFHWGQATMFKALAHLLFVGLILRFGAVLVCASTLNR